MKQSTLLALLLVIAAFLGTSLYSPDVRQAKRLRFTPVADSFVTHSRPDMNRGSKTQLRVKRSPKMQSYIRFNVQGVGERIERAVLRLYSKKKGSLAGYKLHSVDDDNWAEDTITFENKPRISKPIALSGAFKAHSWTEIDVTSLVAGDGVFTFALTGKSKAKIGLASRESPDHAPQLVIFIQSTPTDIPTSTPTASETSTLAPTASQTSSSTPTDNLLSTPTWTVTPSRTPTYTATSTNPPTLSATFTATQTGTRTATHTGTPPHTPTSTPTRTPTPTRTVTHTGTPPHTPTSTRTPTMTRTATWTATPTRTLTYTATPSRTSTRTATPTPTSGGSDPVLVGAGDIANCERPGDEATANLLDDIQGTVFTLGDNAYPDGTATDFANCYEPTWGRHKQRTYPAPGNHDYHIPGATGYFNYFGARAGDPSKGYYSYNLGQWHIIALNTELDVRAGSVQEQWLRQDLAAHPNFCTLAYWHHPRFSSGAHGNVNKMQAFWQALYDYDADIVLSGHDHIYERFAPQKPDGTADSANGIREFVVGTGGTGLYDISQVQPNSQARNVTAHGVLKLTLHPTSYTWAFVPIAGMTFTDTGTDSCH